MAPSKSAMMAASLATAACPALAFQPSSSIRGAPADASQSTVQHHQTSASSMDSEPMAVSGRMAASGVATLAAAAVLMAGARRTSKAPAKVQLQAFEGERGVQAPVGFWDPLGLAADGDVATFRRRRAVEIKHGRICMLACIGYIVPEYVKFPGYLAPSEGLKFADVPNGLGALAKVPAEGWLQIGLFLGHYEGYFFQQEKDRSPGDFEGYGFLGIGKNFIFDLPTPELSDADKEKKLSVEIANGRLAMVAIIGMFYQDGLTGSAWGDWSLYTDSPLRAFESELGAQPPLGFWDPLGFSADGDVYSFTRRRSVEIKHGRICMLATMGYMTPEITGKLPGYLSPSENVKFADVPNGLAAISKVPILGWCQIILYMAFCEINGGYDQDVQKGKPGDFGFKVITSSDPEALKKKLSAEIANGRLAMMAIMGMFFQDGLTGSAWGDWSLYTDSPLRAFESELGAQPPLGFWDPLGLSADGDVDFFKRRREVEIKHGRVAMYAAMGYIVPEYFRFPGYLSPKLGLKFDDVPNGLAAFSKVPSVGWQQIVSFIGIYELFINKPVGDEPGNFGKGNLGIGLGKLDEATRARKLASELANGRLAMMAIIGMFFQDGLTGSAWGDWANYTDSPLRAFESELGAQPPLGFWDPLGFSADGDVYSFTRRRSVEIKHGRICMLATMGYMTPEITGKLPGYLSPSENVKFADVPNGLAAISKVPILGWCQIILYMAFCEINGGYDQDVQKGKPGDFGFKVITSSDPEALKKKLSAEIANGRLAMMAIMGMFFQDGLTGSAWGDWSLYTDSPLRAFESELGVQAPVGYWDPLGFARDGNVALFKIRRATEIKHGRISMLAAMGYITPEVSGKFPGYLSPSMGLKFADIPNGLAAISKVPGYGWAQILGWMAFCEISVDQSPGTPGAAGDMGFKAFKVTADAPETTEKKLASELANGRLAMMAIIGMFFQDGLTGSAWGDWANFTESPLRAFESELGAQAPVGFFDPLGLSSDGDVETFKRRRASEIKHGRIAMLATMGYMTPELTGKFPGYLSPSAGLKFADIPNGLAAVSKVPAAGWAQVALYAFHVELIQDQSPGTPGQAGDFGFKVITSDDEEVVKRKLASELANGRLAMMAIIGMFFQDGLTGSAYGDWANYTDSPLRAFESELGVQAPVGYWDPLGFARDGNVALFKIRRATEIKHGRISMLAAMGYITPEVSGKFPGYLSPSMGLKFADIPNGLAAISKVPGYGWAQILGWMAFCEISVDQSPGTPGAAGDMGFKAFKVTADAPETTEKKLASELANGRLAMMAIIGMFFQDGLTGSAWGDWANFTESPLRAFESELGAQAPLGFFDPLKLTGDGSVEAFKRRRQSEIKHGRISMLAAMGYMTPEITGKFPGYLSPSLGLKFADVPNGLAAVSKVPAAGWAQILGYMAYCETSQDQSAGTPGAAGEFGFKVITSDDDEVLKRKLASELANGRLAMMAIIGMFYQDGLTGSPWGDWSLYTDSPLR
ncbi:Light-harvesting complex [Amphidinium carterae]